MDARTRTLVPTLPVLSFVFVIVLAHFFTPAGYDLRLNTISEMAAQGLPNAWIMQAGFLGFGALSTVGLLWIGLRRERSWWAVAPFALYAACIALTGIWSTTYPGLDVPVSSIASDLHSLFATVAGFALVAAMLACAVLVRTWKVRGIHLAFAAGVIALSASFGAFPDVQGLFQRAMYVVGFAWMVLVFPSGSWKSRSFASRGAPPV
jgi:hypothetical protein